MKGNGTIPRTREGLRRISRIAAIVSALFALGVLAGWSLSYLPGAPQMGAAAMNPVAAILFLVASAGLYSSSHGTTVSRFNSNPIAFWCAIFLILISMEKLMELAFGYGPCLDGFLFESKIRAPGGLPDNVLATNTVLCFLFCGITLLLLDAETRRGMRPAQPLILVTLLISLLALVGHTYNVLTLYRMWPGPPMALLTALTFAVWSCGALTARPEHGVLTVINSPTTGGAMARRLLPMAILIPWVLGVTRWAGECMGYYGTQFGVALFTVATIVIFSTLVWWNARLLHKADLERLEAEERLRQAGADLARSNMELQQFAYIASHDLSEPLRMISSYLQLLQQAAGKDHLDPKSQEYVTFALEGAVRMRALITDLLAYSRVEARGQPFQKVDCNLAVDAALSNLKVAIEESGAKITFRGLPWVEGDMVQLTQVFQNLIGNAIKFRGTEPPRVHVTAEQLGGEWLFSVKDNGIGINPDYFDRIFEIFQRLHTRREYPGTGMGLAICKKIIERHGGRIWVESVVQKGSDFKFTLPRIEQVNPSADPGA